MNKFVECMLNLDFAYWQSANSYFSSEAINTSMKGGLSLIQNQRFLSDFNPKTASDYVNAMDVSIEEFKVAAPDYELLVNIFDHIQAWGDIS